MCVCVCVCMYVCVWTFICIYVSECIFNNELIKYFIKYSQLFKIPIAIHTNFNMNENCIIDNFGIHQMFNAILIKF